VMVTILQMGGGATWVKVDKTRTGSTVECRAQSTVLNSKVHHSHVENHYVL
jgi:hypothetical protein